MSDTYTPFAPLQYDRQEVATRGWGMASPNVGRPNVSFHPVSVTDPIRSRELGYTVKKTIHHIKIFQPGEANLQVKDQPVTEEEKQFFAREWYLYSKGVEAAPDGMPITLLFPSHPHIPDMLRGHGIHTVEQLAELSGTGISSVGMGAQEWVNAARKYLDQAKKGVDFHKFESAMKTKDQEIATLKRQVNELAVLIKSRTSDDSSPPQQPRRSYQPPSSQDFDYQTAQINDSHASSDDSQAMLQPPAQFAQDIGSVEPPKRRGGRPKGSTNKPKET